MANDSVEQQQPFCNSDLEKYRFLRYRALEEQLVTIQGVFERSGVDILFIKGWVAAQNYPKPFLRPLGDIDICVDPSKFKEAAALARDLPEYVLDVHCGLRTLDSKPWSLLYSNSELVTCGTGRIRTLRLEDHLRVLCTHWLVDSGSNRDKLYDIYYLVENRSEDFDWTYCLDTVDPVRRNWVVATIGVAHNYFGLRIDDLPFSEEAKNLPSWFVSSLENEWSYPLPLIPLYSVLNKPKQFWKQLKKRIPPNPIQATVEMNGKINEGSRFYYQAGNFCFRLSASIKHLTLRLFRSR